MTRQTRGPARGKTAGARAAGARARPSRTSAAQARPTSAPPRPKKAEPVPEPINVGVQTLVVTEDEAEMRLDRWFKRRMPALSLGHLNKIVRTGQVRVDGKRVETSTRLEAGQSVRIPPVKAEPPPASPAVKRVASEADARALKDMVLFEDKWLMVLNKPWGLAVQGGSGTKHHIDGMLESLADANGERPRLVHRLDRDTSGVLLIAKTRKIAADLGEMFRSRQARKIYWSIVHGVPKPPQGRISLFLAKGAGMGDERGERQPGVRKDPERMRIAKHGEEDAQHSITYYATVDKVAPRLAWLSMKPITGRTHQLRAHAEAIGHPIVGDPKYTGDFAEKDPRRTDPLRSIPSGIENKLHLVARRLVLPHPKGGWVDVTAPLPPHMQATFDMFGFDVKQHDPIEDAPEE
jgi:23S rRNA pseudouridine955/2504/2580 synthase